jgi:hypothetical protein
MVSKEKGGVEIAEWVHQLAPWSVIAHQTFAWEASLASAQRCFEKFMKRDLPSVSYFYAIEQNPSRDGHHVHALWSDCVGVQRSAMWKRWHDRYGRNRIEPVNSQEDVTSYCAKYVTKAGAWWNVKLVSSDLWHGARRLPKT